jgi:GTP-binding protein
MSERRHKREDQIGGVGSPSRSQVPVPDDGRRRPVVAVVGAPNAGKSTLINRLTATRTTVVHEMPGVTRDRKVVPVEWNGKWFDLVDTGGFDREDGSPFAAPIRAQVETALTEADLVLFVVDAKNGPLPADHEMADVLRRARVPLLLLGNKLDDPNRAVAALADLFELGVGEARAISALHGLGVGDLLDDIVAHLGTLPAQLGETAPEELETPISVAIVGRPNAGKSSLFNAAVGGQRTIVSELPGTTRDAIDTTVQTRHGRFLFVDTAGMRKAAKVSGVEYYSYLRSLQTLDRAHVAIVVTDITVGIGELDLSIASEATRRGCATVLAVNKCDLQEPDLEDVRALTGSKLRQRPPVMAVSAQNGAGVDGLLATVARVDALYNAHIGTPALNRALGAIFAARPGPRQGNRRLKAYYMSQYAVSPPRFAVEVNDRGLVTRDFGYYVENRLRTEFGLEGVPVIIDFKSKERS